MKSAALRKEPKQTTEKGESPQHVFVGKDVLELLSSAMYLDPLTIYREYVQNAADAIEEARATGLLKKNQAGLVEISVNVEAETRSITIRDNGCGVDSEVVVRRLTSLGGSQKRGTSARGFRGVGRLAGLGYCQELIFRTKTTEDDGVTELRWDCRKLKALLRDPSHKDDLAEVVRKCVRVHRKVEGKWPDHFFEVELKAVVRHKDDRLLSPDAIANYLAQVAPVPFSPDFKYGQEIAAKIRQHVPGEELDIRIDGGEPVYKPHRNRIPLANGKSDGFTDVDYLEVPTLDGGIGAIAWVLNHGYHGSIPVNALLKGIRFRCGNIQVGDNSLLEELFAEPRFNGWSVGEVHVIDKRVIPNGRRDHFEQGNHFNNLVSQLNPLTTEITKKCRAFSLKRRLIRDFELNEMRIKERFEGLRRSGLTTTARQRVLREVKVMIAAMEKISGKEQLPGTVRSRFHGVIEDLRSKLKRRGGDVDKSSPLSKLPVKKRKLFQQMFSLIYEHAANKSVANALINRIIEKSL